MLTGSIIMDIAGLSPSVEEAQMLSHPLVGGVILFSRNVQDYTQIRALTTQLRALDKELLISVDQEGGRVQRLTRGFTKLPAMAKLAATRDLGLAKNWGWLLASEVLSCGVDLSFAPVLDLDTNRCPAIGSRSVGTQLDSVLPLHKAFMAGLQEAGMRLTGKHFPGHGGVSQDSHRLTPVDERSFEELRHKDLLPFIQAIAQHIDALMIAHVRYPKVDEQVATFSKCWLQSILKKRLHFQGVIFSDDICMQGAKVAGSFAERAHAAFQAGCDVTLVCNNFAAVVEVIKMMENRGYRSYSTLWKKMHAKRSCSFEQLKNSARWQETRSQLNFINTKRASF